MGANDEMRRVLGVARDIQAAVTSTRLLPARPSQAAVPSTALFVPAPSDVELPTPTAFVSWAHSHSTWTNDQTSDWESQIAAFAATLRHLGVAAEVDLFHLDEAIDWTRFGPRQIQVAKFTLIVMSSAWAERWSGANSPREGAGAAAEADTLKGLFTRNQETWQHRVVIVMFPDVPSDVVPPDLQRVARVSVDPADPDSYEPLIRLLTEQPRYPKPPVGTVPVFKAKSGYVDSERLKTLRARLDEIKDRRQTIEGETTNAANTEREQLVLSESVTRGLIDAELTMDD